MQEKYYNTSTYKSPSRRNKNFFRKIWQFRYRVYSLLVILIIVPILFYANDINIPENIAVEGLGYEISQSNLFASQLRRINKTTTIPQKEDDLKADRIEFKEGQMVIYDKNGKIITEQLRKAGFNLGFISSQPFVDMGENLNITAQAVIDLEEKIQEGEVAKGPENPPLDTLIPRNQNPGALTNLLVYDKYKIRVPVIYSGLEDLFDKNADQTFNFNSPRDTSDGNSPVQQKLIKGIVHLGYTPMPGEVGNSYIVGHSSNYSWVKSPYNYVFAPLKERSQVGETFEIYDNYGRELKFRVFEVKKIADDDVTEAYKSYDNKRVVTLQTSILGTRNGQIAATHRWLTRGELIL